MPNIGHQDYISPHRHSAFDAGGLDALLFPMPSEAVGIASGPTTNTGDYENITDMTLTLTPPTSWPLWEYKLVFNTQLSLAAAAGAGVFANVQLTQDGTVIPHTRRFASNINNGANYPFSVFTFATIVLPAGVAAVIRAQFKSSVPGNVLTASGVARRLIATPRPYSGAA